MGDIPKFPDLTGQEKLPELIERIGVIQKTLNWLGAGNISSVNAREFGGYFVNQTELKSRDGDVGMSSANDADDPVRLWAGSTDKDTAPWRVYKSGKGVATGWRIQSRDGGYPYAVLDPDDDLLGLYTSADTWIRIFPYLGSPALQFSDGTYLAGFSFLLGKFSMSSGSTIRISAGSDIELVADAGSVKLDSWAELVNAATSQSLQSALDGKAGAFSGYSGSVSTDTNTLSFSNGILTSVS